jgi:hypothetical protein
VPATAPLPADAQEYAGWYEPASPRNQIIYFLERLAGLQRITFGGGNLLLSSLGQTDQPFVPVSGEQFRYLPKKDHAEPIATAALLTPNAEGRFVFIGGTLRRIPAWEALAEIVLVFWFVFAVLDILLYAPFWIIGGFVKSRRRTAERGIRLWPLLAALSLVAFIGFFMASTGDVIARLGNLTFYSGGLFVTTLLFALFTFLSALALWNARNQPIRGYVRWFSICVTSALVIAAAYLTWWGAIGMRTWS